MADTTQSKFPIKDIKQDLVLLNDGSVAVVLQTSAVNFDLLSGNEQLAIISTFAALLNSLSFYIQIIIRSKRLDITSYLKILEAAEQKQENPLLKRMMQHYKNFIQTTISENEVLDKQFYVIIPVSSIEVGIISDPEKKLQKAMTVLLPRRDHIIRQLARIGLKATQLSTEQLVKLFYDIYNDSEPPITKETNNKKQDTKDKKAEATQAQPIPSPAANPQPQTVPTLAVNQPVAYTPAPNIVPQPVVAASQTPPAPTPQPPTQSAPPSNYPQRANSNTPFVVEELHDEYGTV